MWEYQGDLPTGQTSFQRGALYPWPCIRLTKAFAGRVLDKGNSLPLNNCVFCFNPSRFLCSQILIDYVDGQLVYAPARTMLIVLLIIAAGGIPIIENPNSTLLNAHPRFQHVVALLKEKGMSPLLEFQHFWVICFCHVSFPKVFSRLLTIFAAALLCLLNAFWIFATVLPAKAFTDKNCG